MKMWTYAQLYPNTPANRRPSEPHRIRFWMVEMSTGGGTYIVLPGTHHTEAGAERAIPENLKDICRAQEYETGRGNGPERVT